MSAPADAIVDLDTLVQPGDAGYVEPHLHVRIGADDEGLRLHRVSCSCNESGFEPRALTPAPVLVFVEHGSFRRRTPAGDILCDAGFAYFGNPGAEEEYAHPRDGGDVCSAITVSPRLLGEITGGELALPEGLVPVDARTHRGLRRLVGEAHCGSGGGWVEQGIQLVAGLVRAKSATSVPVTRPRTRAAHARLANQAREAVVAHPELGVTELARLVGCSPFHLSRVFRGETGTTISTYRLRVRVREAAARIEAGEENLARLACELGFSDHSHMTRLLARELGQTPTAIRRTMLL
ncbi:MAG TPA: AraC family transcriptional regulator [Thermoleophilaceae bacterium]